VPNGDLAIAPRFQYTRLLATLAVFATIPLCVVLGAAVVVVPQLAVALVLGVSFLVLAWLYPKMSLGVTAVAILFSSIPTHLDSSFKSVNEFLVVGTFSVIVARRLLFTGSLRRLPGDRWFLLYLAAGATSSVVNDVPVYLGIFDAFLFLKGILFGYAVSQLDWSLPDLKRLIIIGGRVSVAVLLFTTLNLIFGHTWYADFASHGTESVRGGITALIGPFDHPGPFGQMMSLMSLAFLLYRLILADSKRSSQASLLGFAITTLGVLISVRRKAFVGLLGAAISVSLLIRRTRLSTSLVLAVLILLFVTVGWNTFASILSHTYNEYIGHAGTAARTVLYSTSFELAKIDFPFGAGLGRYGGAIAAEYYSPVYVHYGFLHVYGLEPRGNFTTDTFWPAILGEAGIIGVIGYFGGLVAMTKTMASLRDSEVREIRFLGLLGFAWSVEFLIESVAEPAYSSPPLFPLLFGLVGIAAVLTRHPSHAEPSVDTTTLATATPYS
jgi:hypothetical protein